MTEYIVFEKGGTGGWNIIGFAKSHGPIAAARKVDRSGVGEFLSVPVRNATFVNLGSEVPPPKVTATEVSPDQYRMPELPLDEPEPVEVVA